MKEDALYVKDTDTTSKQMDMCRNIFKKVLDTAYLTFKRLDS